MAKVFISFIHEEQSVAKAIETLLRQKLKFHDVFLSSEWQIYAGDDWLTKIRVRALRVHDYPSSRSTQPVES